MLNVGDNMSESISIAISEDRLKFVIMQCGVIQSGDSEIILGESSVIAMDVEIDLMTFIVKGNYIDICTVLYNCEKCNHERLRVS